MWPFIRRSTVVGALLSTAALICTTGEAFAESHFSPSGDNPRQDRDERHHADKPRVEPPRIERHRIEERRSGHPDAYPSRRQPSHEYYRYDYRYRPTPPYRPWQYIPRYRYNDIPWYRYPNAHYYPRHRYYYRGDDFFGWLAFTAITLAIIDNLNEHQQREHELILRDALDAPVGETIIWHDSDASGSVTVIREGTSSEGRYCREYTQEVQIAGESQQAYGTACRNPDGSWEIMN